MNLSIGVDNTFIGDDAGIWVTTGSDNTFIGDDAGKSTTTGRNNTIVGSSAGFSNNTGYQNTFVGRFAGYDNTTGYYNTALGDSAGNDNSIGRNNTFLGHATGAATEYGNNNTFVGNNAGWDNNRTNNTGDANGNTYVGSYAGYTNRTGQFNCVMGYLANFQSPSNISGLGHNSYNVALGYRSLIGSNQSYMVLIGRQTYGGAPSAIAIGDSSRSTGANSTALGPKSNVSGNNSVAIGFGAFATADNQVYIGNSTVASIGGAVNWTAISDRRFKSNVQENVAGLDFINRLRPVTYHMDPAAIEAYYGRELPAELREAAQEKRHLQYSGFLAQEVEAAAIATNYEFSGIDLPAGPSDAYGLRYAEFTVPLVKAVQELSAKVDALETQLANRDQQVETLSQELYEIKAAIYRLETESKAGLVGGE